MASFNDHIKQAKDNLSFLGLINKSDNFWDWQTTVCFYVGVHLVNSHLANKANLHYRSHEEVSNAINPYNRTSICTLPETIYISFINLQWLSRRSRYLISDKKGDYSNDAHFTSNKHFSKAIRHLDILIGYINEEYKAGLPITIITCDRLKNQPLTYFKI